MNTKICSKCKQEKQLNCFSKDKSKKDGYRSNCKTCSRQKNILIAEKQKAIRHQQHLNKIKNIIKNNNDIFEELVPIDGYENYMISKNGNIYSVIRQGGGGIVKHHLNKNTGYIYVSLTKNGISKSKTLHRLLAKTFIENPNNLPFVDHIDRNRQNYNLDNLRWCTPSENTKNSERVINRKGSLYLENNGNGYNYYCVIYYDNGISKKRRFKNKEDAKTFIQLNKNED